MGGGHRRRGRHDGEATMWGGHDEEGTMERTRWGEDTMGEDTTTRHHAEHTQAGEILLAWSRVMSTCRGVGMFRIGIRIGIRIRIRRGEFRDCHIMFRGHHGGDHGASARRR